MAITVTTDLTDISVCNATTDSGNFYRLAGTSSGNPAADADAYVQGTGCIASKMGATAFADVGSHFNSTSTFDLTGKHLYHWRLILTAGNMDLKANKGVSIGLTNTSTTSTSAWSTTNYKQWYLDGKDTAPISTGWTCYALDPTKTADASAGTLDLTTVKNIGFVCRQLSGVTTTVSNQFVDVIRMGTGITATASSAADTVNFASLYATDSLLANAWGIITRNTGIYYGAGKITIGATGQTNTCLFNAINGVMVWRDFLVANTLYEFNLLGASGNATTFQLGSKDGSGNTSSGCVIRGEGAAVWNITCGTNTNFKAYSSTLANCRAATLSSTSELKNTAISDCGTFDVNGATITGCSFAAQTATQLKVDSASEMALITTCAFTSGGTGHAIEITTVGTYAFGSITFNNFAASNGSTGNEAVYVSATTGTVTINVTSGSTPTIRTAGATVVVNNSNTKTFTNVPSGTEIRVRQGSYTLAHDQDIVSGSYVFSYTASGSPAKVQFTLSGYIFEDIDIVLDSTNQSLPVTSSPDPSYI